MIRVYVEELLTYNSGIAIGGWFTISTMANFKNDLSKLFERASLKLQSLNYAYTKCEEYEIVDYESDIDIDLSQVYTNIRTLIALNDLLTNSNNQEQEIIAFLLHNGHKVSEIETKKEEVKVFEDWEEVTTFFIEEVCQVSNEHLIYNYIDDNKIQRDLALSGYVEYKGKIFYYE